MTTETQVENQASTKMCTELSGFIVVENKDGSVEHRPFIGKFPIELAAQLQAAGVPQTPQQTPQQTPSQTPEN